MKRVFSLILIALLLTTQSLVALPHSHSGMSAEDHAVRPHIHVRGGSHHHGHENDHFREDQGLHSQPQDSEHDSDAFFASDFLHLKFDQTVQVNDISSLAIQVVVHSTISGIAPDDRPGNLRTNLLRPHCALYLQVQAIRC